MKLTGTGPSVSVNSTMFPGVAARLPAAYKSDSYEGENASADIMPVHTHE